MSGVTIEIPTVYAKTKVIGDEGKNFTHEYL
jgi:hypothetical protein